jgi:hypothetical protein
MALTVLYVGLRPWAAPSLWRDLTLAFPRILDFIRRMQKISERPESNTAGHLISADSSLTVRLLTEHRNELLDSLRKLSPELVAKLEMTLQALHEQWPQASEYQGLGRAEVIRKYLLKVGRPVQLREIREAVSAPASRFDARSIWDGGKREVERGRMLNVADQRKGEDWVLALPEWAAD